MNKIRFINLCGAGAKMFQEKVNAMDFMLWFHAGGGDVSKTLMSP